MTFEQLDLPLSGVQLEAEPTRIPRTRRVFVNRNLKMSGIDWVGFDMDYTLAIYRQEEMDRLSIRATLEKLGTRGYSAEILREIPYRIDFPIRGLLIDKRFGHILKMDRFKVVQKGYHGLRELSKDELRALYQQKKIRPTTARYHWIDTLYALSEATLYVGIVDAFEQRGLELDYARLFTDIRECIDEAHRDGTILNEVDRSLPQYVDRDPLLAQTLHKLRSAGKRLFLLTNSRWPFTERMMTHLLGGAMPEYPSFRHYFDIIIVAAQKPAFFQERVEARTAARSTIARRRCPLRPALLPRANRHGNLRRRLPPRMRVRVRDPFSFITRHIVSTRAILGSGIARASMWGVQLTDGDLRRPYVATGAAALNPGPTIRTPLVSMTARVPASGRVAP